VERLTGRTAAGLIGGWLSDLVHPEDRGALVAALTAVFASEEKAVLLHYRRLMADGGCAATEAAGCVSDGLLFLVSRDVRARMATEAALRAFALATSHDLREPCNAVLVSTSLLQRRPCVAASADCRFLVGAICSACGLLLGIVTNVLTARQLEAGALTLNHVLFSPAELIDAVLQACRSGCNTASMAGIAWERGLGDHVPAVVEGDRDRLAQVLQNLVRERWVLQCCRHAQATHVAHRLTASPIAGQQCCEVLRRLARGGARLPGGAGGAAAAPAAGRAAAAAALAHAARVRRRARDERGGACGVLPCIRRRGPGGGRGARPGPVHQP
jgi:hypothetical protein